MRRHAARGNRTGLTLLGLALLLAGAALLAQSRGCSATTPPPRRSTRRPRNATCTPTPGSGRRWPPPPSSSGCSAFAGCSSNPAATGYAAHASTTTATKNLAPDARSCSPRLSDVIDDDLSALPGVRSATGQLAGSPDHPDLWLSITTAADADLEPRCASTSPPSCCPLYGTLSTSPTWRPISVSPSPIGDPTTAPAPRSASTTRPTRPPKGQHETQTQPLRPTRMGGLETRYPARLRLRRPQTRTAP